MGSITNGHRVGRYELVQMLGEGGMGTVWLAHPYDDPDTFYAIKTVSPQFARDPRVCGMFVKEASLAAAIEHPNVVHLYDVGIHDDVPYFVMEWIDGCSLRDVARRVVETGERVPPSIALRIAADLCAGLHAAHELTDEEGHPLGLVHRDVSPHNVLVTREGVAKLIDFGVAKARDLASNSEDSMVGGIKGKVRYMAPEQAMEKDIDRRADIFSVGATTYQLLCGRAPFEGPNEVAILNSLLSTNPVYVPDDLPEPVQWILRRALARRPENRFSDAAEMQNAIELALVEMGAPDKPWDVAECLAWFVPPTEPLEAITSSRRHHQPSAVDSDINTTQVHRSRAPSNSPPPPPLAFAKPTDSIPARRPSLIDPDEIAMQRRGQQRKGGGSMRFVLLAAGVVGLLGVGAAMLVKDPTPSSSSNHGTDQPSTTEVDNAPMTPVTGAPTSQAPVTNPANTPIIDMGDVTDEKKQQTRRRHRPRPPSSETAPAPAPKPAPAPPSGDLAGPVKVWK